MGADQIGFLFKGPAQLDRYPNTIRAAEERAREVLRTLENLHALDDLPERLPGTLRHLCRGDAEEFIGCVADLPEPKVAVNNLLEWWSEGARDTCTRRDPDNPKQIIGFAGDRSWGDEPDGFGYTTYKAALVLDILTIFAIR